VRPTTEADDGRGRGRDARKEVRLVFLLETLGEADVKPAGGIAAEGEHDDHDRARRRFYDVPGQDVAA
jgi:hypothetical protein